MADDILYRVKQIVCDEFNPPDPQAIFPETTLESLGADSLDGVNLVRALEEEFNISISDEALPDLNTVGDLARIVEALRK